MVIPLNVEHKRRVKGFIHGESSTGQTVFLEPTEVLEGNNKIRELEYAERRDCFDQSVAAPRFYPNAIRF